MRVRSYFELLKIAKPKEREKLLENDSFRRRPLARTLVPYEDVPILVEVLNGRDPDLAASAASHLVTMALQNLVAGTRIRNSIAAALPAMMAHYDDANPPFMTKQFVRSKIWRKEVIGFVWLSGATPPPPLVSKILVALKDNEDAVDATSALAQLKPMPKEVLEAVLAKLGEAPDGTRQGMINALVEHGVKDPAFVQFLAAILDNPAERHQVAAEALSRLGSAAKLAEPALLRFVAKAVSAGEESTAQFWAQRALNALSSK